jgi:membrane protease YdiL (CAAX protease family)
MSSSLRAIGACLGLLLVTYVPTFLIVGAMHASLETSVPAIVVISTLIALGLMASLRKWARYTWTGFGFAPSARRYVIWAFIIGVPAALALTSLDHRFGSAGPLSGLVIPFWKALLFFGLCAPIQEEIIFRGLIQTAVARYWSGSVPFGRLSISQAALATAVVFGLVHLEVAAFTAIAALCLGVLAGELRNRSGSLVPAVVVHVLFNFGSFFWNR